jgi:hypothetical protein
VKWRSLLACQGGREGKKGRAALAAPFERGAAGSTGKEGGGGEAATCHVCGGGGRLCASRPLRYVSVINDNNLVSLMNFNAAKVN